MFKHLNLIVNKKEKITGDTWKLTLQEKNNKVKTFDAGQFLIFLLDDKGKEKRRGYSICSSPFELPYLNVAIKDDGDGFTSEFINNLKEGDIIHSLPPLGNFRVFSSPEKKRELFLFGAGSGITPLFSMIKTVLHDEPLSHINLFYGNRFESSIIFKEELDELQKKYEGRLNIVHSLTKPEDSWEGQKGRITKLKALELLNDPRYQPGDEAEFYLCGPSAMMKEITEALIEKGIYTGNIKREVFQVGFLSPDEDIEEIPREVTIVYNGEKYIIKVEPGETILDTAMGNGLDLPHSCQYGNCSSCKAELLSGKIKLEEQTALSEEELESRYTLTCVGYPATDDVVILYED